MLILRGTYNNQGDFIQLINDSTSKNIRIAKSTDGTESVLATFSDDTITTLTATFNSSLSLNSISRIYAYRYQKLVFVSGYIMAATDDDIPNNTVIGTVSGITLKQQVFDSPNGSDGDTSRIKLTTSGSLQIEKAMKGKVWYSFSFTGLIA